MWEELSDELTNVWIAANHFVIIQLKVILLGV